MALRAAGIANVAAGKGIPTRGQAPTSSIVRSPSKTRRLASTPLCIAHNTLLQLYCRYDCRRSIVRLYRGAPALQPIATTPAERSAIAIAIINPLS